MGGYVFHGMAHREQITNIAKICIIGNLRNSLLIYSHLSRNFLLGPSKAAEAEDGGGLAVGIVEYPLDLDRRELGTNAGLERKRRWFDGFGWFWGRWWGPRLGF
jgi:hypothetical protein